MNAFTNEFHDIAQEEAPKRAGVPAVPSSAAKMEGRAA